MRLLLNVLWLVLAGFWLFLAYLFAAVLCVLFIVTIPSPSRRCASSIASSPVVVAGSRVGLQSSPQRV